MLCNNETNRETERNIGIGKINTCEKLSARVCNIFHKLKKNCLVTDTCSIPPIMLMQTVLNCSINDKNTFLHV